MNDPLYRLIEMRRRTVADDRYWLSAGVLVGAGGICLAFTPTLLWVIAACWPSRQVIKTRALFSAEVARRRSQPGSPDGSRSSTPMAPSSARRRSNAPTAVRTAIGGRSSLSAVVRARP
jgi:hypothetical protein